MSGLQEFTTGVTEETHYFIWNVRNCRIITKNENLIAEQKIKVDIGTLSGVRTKWLFGHHVHGNKKYSVFLQLLGLHPPDIKLLPNVSIYFTKEKDNPLWTPSVAKIFETKPMVIGEKLISEHEWPIGFEHFTDAEGTRRWRLKMNLLLLDRFSEDNTQTAMHELKAKSIMELQQQYQSHLNDSKTQDLTIICKDGTELNAHKSILSVRNPVFAAMLNSKMSEQITGVLHIDDISGNVMKILLQYFYTGELNSDWCNQQNIVEFTYAAGKYQLSNILEMLDKTLGTMEESTCNFMLLSLAEKLSLKTAEAKLLESIAIKTCNAKSAADLAEIFSSNISDTGLQ